MSENPEKTRKTHPKRWKYGCIIFVVLFIIALVYILCNQVGFQKETENMAYAAKTVQLYSGPSETEYVTTEEVSGHFTYEYEQDGWLAVKRKNSVGENVLRWIPTDSLTSWGEYRHSSENLSQKENLTVPTV